MGVAGAAPAWRLPRGGRGVGVNSARCAPLAVSCSSPAQRADTIQTVLQHSSSPGVEFESKMTGALQRWARARRAFGGPDASGVDWNPNLAFWGAAHTVLLRKRRARAAEPVRTQAAVLLSVLLFRTEPFVRPRCICVGIGCTAPFWSVAAARALGIPRGAGGL